MSIYVTDAGSRYLVKAENIDAAYEWLKEEGEFAHRVGTHKDCIVLSANGFEDMFCGYVSYHFDNYVEKFLELFCESGSYACFRNDDEFEYALIWKDDDGVHSEWQVVGNPFESKIEKLEG